MTWLWNLLRCRERRKDEVRCLRGLFHRGSHFFGRKRKVAT